MDKDEVSSEDVEIRSRRLIEERRNSATGEKQHLKEVSKQKRKCIRDKKESKRQEKIQRILEECRGIKNISCIKSARKRVESLKTTEARQSHREKGSQMSSANSNAKIFDSTETEEKFQNTLSHDTRAVGEKKTMEKMTLKNTLDHR